MICIRAFPYQMDHRIIWFAITLVISCQSYILNALTLGITAYHLCYTIYEVADIFEKETNRNYPLAIALYELLLQLPFIEHRRGKWYKRLCIDLEHLKLPLYALHVAMRGLEDANILVSKYSDLQLVSLD